MAAEEQVDDYTTYPLRGGGTYAHPAEDTVVMIVREGQRYGHTEAGGKVRVTRAEAAEQAPTKSRLGVIYRALMTPEEAGDIAQARERKRAEKAAPPKPGRLKAAVDAALGNIPDRHTGKPAGGK